MSVSGASAPQEHSKISSASMDASANPHKPHDIVCFSDGSCLNNGSKNASLRVSAGYACVFPNHPRLTISVTLDSTIGVTNNRAEYSAFIKALEICNDVFDAAQSLYFYTDSQLLINTCTKWMASWKRTGWRKADGVVVSNLDLVKRIDELSCTRHVVFTHVKAHTGRYDWMSLWNAKADALAKSAASSDYSQLL